MNIEKLEKKEEHKIQQDFNVIKKESEGGLFSHGHSLYSFSKKYSSMGSKFLLGLIMILLLNNPLSAGVKELKETGKKLKNYIETYQISPKQADSLFERLIKDFDTVLKKSINEHGYQNAIEITNLYLDIAKYLEDKDQIKYLRKIKTDLENEMNVFEHKKGIFVNENKLMVSGEFYSGSISKRKIEWKIETDSGKKLINYIYDTFKVKKIISNKEIIGFERKGNKILYLIEYTLIESSENPNLITQIKEKVPKLKY